MSQNIKILVGYHKPAVLLKNSFITPIHIGRSVAQELSKDGSLVGQDLEWLLDNMSGDEAGNNISDQNRFYNEMTGIYWAWKNQDKLNNPDYIGSMHYRRQFIFDDQAQTKYAKNPFFAKGSQYSVDHLKDEEIKNLFNEDLIKTSLQNVDAIVPRPMFSTATVYEQYKKDNEILKITDLDLALDVIKEHHSKYYKTAFEYLHSNHHYFWNMFIFKTDIFNEYCEWIFDILDKLQKKLNLSVRSIHKQRALAHISERLTGIFILELKKRKNLIINEKYSIFQRDTELTHPITPYFKEGSVPIVFSSDDNYAPYLGVAIKSLIENTSKDTNYEIFILDGEISLNNQKLITSLATGYNNINLKFIDMKYYLREIDIKKLHLHSHFTLATYFRFFVPQALACFDKVIYLDSDIVILDDVAKLFNYNLENNILGAVTDVEINRLVKTSNTEYKRYFSETLGINNIDHYFQAGVLIFNIKKMLAENFQFNCLKRLEEIGIPKFVDQDVLNSLCKGQITILPNDWNVEWQILLKNDDISKVIPANMYTEYLNAYKKPKIIHYCSEQKPWKSPQYPLSYHFWKYARQTPFYEAIIYKNTIVAEKPKSLIPPVNIFEYLKYRILSKLTFGKTRQRYKSKKRQIKERLNKVRTSS